ncbi:hypothetical protein HY404_01085 [Candidatus Microgenomates bacterium]|nr:hypothetical protein [Candidatus Microgenomates bacterium]
MSLNPEIVKKAIQPPVNLLKRVDFFNLSFTKLITRKPEKTSEELDQAFYSLSRWLNNQENSNYAAILVRETVEFLQNNEQDILSESHNIIHDAEAITCLLDDKGREIEIDNATIFIATAVTLLHDLGRTTEKIVIDQPLENQTQLHHDQLSYRAARKILKEISKDSELPEDIKSALELLIFHGLRHSGELNQKPYIGLSYDLDRRQLTGSTTVVRDIPFFGGWQNISLSTDEIKNWPAGYLYPHTFFLQQRFASNIFRDEPLKEKHQLDEVYNKLAVEGSTIVLLACGDNQDAKELAFDVDLGLVDIPETSITDKGGRRWWPKRRLPAGTLAKSAEEARNIEELINSKPLSKIDFEYIMESYLEAYTTFIDENHLYQIKESIREFDQDDRIKWARVLFYSHRKNQERYAHRIKIFWQEKNRGSFLGKIAEPFIDVLAAKHHQRENLEKVFKSYWSNI